ncbi:denticleless homolog [Pelobates cultripes]|uniref:Denticleless homolog n=1 Tax=Pelobates cultripes TaxID=61616 RepID=A0AAD1RH34_PELCU|nr:denticleless homolog [Pelobates cultripes]
MLFQSVVSRPRLGWRHRGSTGYPLYSLLEDYQCVRPDEHTSYGELGMPVPPFGCSFSAASDIPQVLAVANEEGIVRLYDTECQDTKKLVVKEWMAHTNAVFDIAWVPGEHKIVTASGDQTAKLWDVKASEVIGVCRGHQCSLKSVAFSKFETAVFSTGGRDGNIMVWDTRCNKKDGFYRHVNQIAGAHNALEKQTPSKTSKKKKPAIRGLAPSVDFQQSVTVVIFQDEQTIISAGAVDGIVKVWDLRKNYTVYRQDPIPSKIFPYPGNSTRKLGYTSLVLDSTGTNLFANCTDDNIYMFNATGLRSDPVSVFSGHQNSTFYIKSSVSPDGHFLLSGSSDSSAYIWQVSDPQVAPVTLQGHSLEVTSVTWCPSDFTKIATCSDDNTVRIWRLKRNSGEQKMGSVGWASQKKSNDRTAVSKLCCTPGKTTSIHRSPGITSPTPASCAPSNTGDLPLPSVTAASTMLISKLQTPTRKKVDSITGSPKQLSTTKISLKDWVTRTPKSCTSGTDSKTPSPRKAFTPIEQYSTVPSSRGPPQHEKRVKRRLETSSEDMEHDCVSTCNCVTELEPGLKKSKLDLCSSDGNTDIDLGCLSLATLSKNGEGKSASNLESVALVEDIEVRPALVSSGLPDKENSSPEKNWLSALGNKLKTDKPCNQSKISSSPSSRNGSAKKHQTKSITNSPTTASTTPRSMRKICTYFVKKPSE